jgi:hypothetical protein
MILFLTIQRRVDFAQCLIFERKNPSRDRREHSSFAALKPTLFGSCSFDFSPQGFLHTFFVKARAKGTGVA